MRTKHLNQAFVLGAMLVEAFQLVATRSESATRRMAQPGDVLGGFQTGVNQVFGQCAENAVAPGETLPIEPGLSCDARRAVSMTPQAEVLMTAVTPPDWA